MAYEQKPNSGSVFPNDKKGNDKAPDLKGTFNINGKPYQIALWQRHGNKGTFYSVAIQGPQAKKDSDGLPF